jgi:Gp5 C-terminal repeat (3 copies)
MRHLFDARWGRLTILVVALLAMAGGIAYATIPGSSNVYTACMLKNVGTMRLIDPSLPSSNLMSHCTTLETQVSWNQQGQNGAAGAPGKDAVNPTVAQLSAGDSHCPAGGAAITDSAGTTAYVCSGVNGKDGQPFAGTFTSPNGQFALTVADSGIELKSPNATLSLPQAPLLGVRVISTGQLYLHANQIDTEAMHDQTMYVADQFFETVDHDATIHVKHDRTETVDNNQTSTIHGDHAERVDGNQSIMIGGNRTETVAGTDSVSVTGNRSETVSGSEDINVAVNRSQTVGSNDTLNVGANHRETIGGALSVSVAGQVDLRGSMVAINGGGSNCQPVARQGDFVSPSGVIATGSATVCVGP